MTASDYDNRVYTQAINMGMPAAVAQNIVAQARHESGNYSSSVFQHSNNAFGYTYYSGALWQTGGNYNGYAVYDSIQDSTAEVVDWLKRRQNEGKLSISNLTTPEAYATALKNNGYFKDTLSNYTNGIKAALARIDWKTLGVTAGIGTGTIILVAALIYLLIKK